MNSDPRNPGPLMVSARNCLLLFGLSWATVRRLARQYGIAEMRVRPRLVLIEAAPLIEALRREAVRTELREAASCAPRELTDEEERVLLRARLGMVKVQPRPPVGGAGSKC